jgi:membrane-associated protein
MDTLLQLLDFVLHLDTHLTELLMDYGVWVYAILFLLIFCETGLVVLPFLPGDSLLFIAGAVAAPGGINPFILALVLIVAAVTGNTVNYWIGRYLGPRVFKWEDSRWFNRKALASTSAFYKKHGGKAVVISRFMPIIRTFIPFVAGIGAMDHLRFQMFNVSGAILWVGSLIAAGHFFGNIPAVRNNLTPVILAIVVISLLPAVIAYWRQRAAR